MGREERRRLSEVSASSVTREEEATGCVAGGGRVRDSCDGGAGGSVAREGREAEDDDDGGGCVLDGTWGVDARGHANELPRSPLASAVKKTLAFRRFASANRMGPRVLSEHLLCFAWHAPQFVPRPAEGTQVAPDDRH